MRSLRVTRKYNLKLNGGYDVEQIVFELIDYPNDKIGYKIRMLSSVNGTIGDAFLYMNLSEFLEGLGVDLEGKLVRKKETNGPTNKEAQCQ